MVNYIFKIHMRDTLIGLRLINDQRYRAVTYSRCDLLYCRLDCILNVDPLIPRADARTVRIWFLSFIYQRPRERTVGSLVKSPIDYTTKERW